MAINTLKFSQFNAVGNPGTNDAIVGIQSAQNALYNEAWTFLPPGTTAQRPTPSSTVNNRLRFNTQTGLYEYYNSATSAWATVNIT